MKNNSLTAVPGIRVGHYSDREAATGCTAILCPPKTVGGVDVRGGAPGTRETDALQTHNLVSEVTAVVLSGGSAFGLAAADGVMRWHAERGLGYRSRGGGIVPIVPAAILYDLSIGRADVYPDAEAGWQACENASSGAVERGSVGAGTGACIGGLGGKTRRSKGGIGSAAIALPNGLIVAALMAVNALGDVMDDAGTVIGGMRAADGPGFASSLEALAGIDLAHSPASENTVIGVVASNAQLDKAAANKVAQMAHDGIARAVRPAHTMFDGDTIFALATGQIASHSSLVGAYAAEMTASAIRDAIRSAVSLAGVRAIRDDESA